MSFRSIFLVKLDISQARILVNRERIVGAVRAITYISKQPIDIDFMNNISMSINLSNFSSMNSGPLNLLTISLRGTDFHSFN